LNFLQECLKSFGISGGSRAIGFDTASARVQLGQVRPVLLAPSRHAGYNLAVAPAAQTIRVKVLFFGRLKEIIGHGEESIASADATTIEQLFALYSTRNSELAKYRPSLVASRNQEFVGWDTPLQSGDEVAFLPPVSGG
jgi:molybdopterin synthase sulfur carrier subunit